VGEMGRDVASRAQRKPSPASHSHFRVRISDSVTRGEKYAVLPSRVNCGADDVALYGKKLSDLL
jgi:hypothetical protein